MDYGTIGGSIDQENKAGPRWLNRLALLYALSNLPPAVPEPILMQTILQSGAMDWFGYAEALAEAVSLKLALRWPGVSLTNTGRQALEKLNDSLHTTVRERIKEAARSQSRALPLKETRSAHYTPQKRGALCRLGLYKNNEMEWREVTTLSTQAAREACREWVEDVGFKIP
ncbi:MAG: DUF4364 family protein [Clostridia bacterium]|nr:DUF4364 family protein [Clostridia bacterium]